MKKIHFCENYSSQWDKICWDSPIAWFWHTSFRMQHALDCSFSIKSYNLSFFLEENNEIIAIVPLIVDDHIDHDGNIIRQMSYGGSKTPMPIVKHSLKRAKVNNLYKIIFYEIDRLALENDIKRLVMWIPPNPVYCKNNFYSNFLMKYGFNDNSLNTQIIDLTYSKEELFNDFEENHKRAVKKGQKYLSVTIYDYKNINKDIFDGFKSFYFRIAGKITRPENIFKLLYYYLCNDIAVMGVATYKNIVVGYVVVICYKQSSYYLMGANEKDFDICPIAHIIHWNIIQYLKDREILYYEVGIQQYDELVYDHPSEKELNISLFKRGFGGFTIPVFIGEKFYCKHFFKNTYTEHLKSYQNIICQNIHRNMKEME